ncbi:MAG: hypothetical protein HN725_04450 [Alphaproteobacteria bacterium]|jgi:hypothetical protein|nr:hypothetical protein [Alphaproteobacteria bacterium]MBT4084439.1 hypothetical protein [Alphaproteobacteria bacterium]MBT4544035.1 hypothetical protein [Alphaproteobacteria bacterium]MBT7744518.1 hypothetical protein [Alphaproteobacteria bacterium]
MQHTLLEFIRTSALATVICLLLSIAPGISAANEVDVVRVKVHKSGPGVYRFDVTLRHKDIGWKHYANAWEVLTPDGKILDTRILAHPHVNEQPFTRSLSGVKIPMDIKAVTIRARDLVHEYGGKTMIVKLP